MSALYASRALKLTEASDKSQRASVLDDFIADLDGKRPTDEEFDAAFAALEFTEDFTADKRKIQYVLRRFYEFEAGSMPVNYQKMTIEHLVPQSKGGERVGELGNLIYVSETLNNKLDDKSFSAKKKLLKEAKGEWIPSDVVGAVGWGEDEIEKRTASMAELGREKVWS
jgi:uncharacterized protein DUF1524